ncbi:MAG: hypothetical protein IPO65_07190 [Saprospiraceae bacterium]|nr:hypothetical protein [Saprospiraceae bacterium]
MASNGTGLVSFKLNGTKTELREFPKAFFDAKKIDFSQPFQFKYFKKNKNEFASHIGLDINFPIFSLSTFLNPQPDHTHNKYHTFNEITREFEHSSDQFVWESNLTDASGNPISDIIVCNNIISDAIGNLGPGVGIYFHFEETPVSLNRGSSGVPISLKKVAFYSFSHYHMHQAQSAGGGGF